MNRFEMAMIAQNKVSELDCLVASKSGNKNPDYYKTLKELKLWCIIQALLSMPGDEDVTLNDTIMKYFEECSAGIKRAVMIEVHEGDDTLQLLEKYDGVKDVYKKIKKACEDAGLKIEGSTIVKA